MILSTNKAYFKGDISSTEFLDPFRKLQLCYADPADPKEKHQSPVRIPSTQHRTRHQLTNHGLATDIEGLWPHLGGAVPVCIPAQDLGYGHFSLMSH